MRKLIILLSLVSAAYAWAPRPNPSRTSFQSSHSQLEELFDPVQFELPEINGDVAPPRPEAAIILASSVPIIFTPETASAAVAFASTAVPSALAAYGHYVALLGMLGCTMAERLTIKPNMTPEEEDFVAGAHIGLGVFGALIAYTGYLRAMVYEKGFDFYAHEPIFWLKVALVGVYGAASFFNTTVIIKRAVAKRNGDFKPMGEKLSKRMIQICNAELVAIATIPLIATVMARGVGYSEEFPWQAEAALAAVVFLGLSFKYLKEAFVFEDV
ncbi:hypothetical protein ACHAXA_011786 [Cyclostephanos tholiformis]|uniref:Uncharacterized protein n=1 Tax=Cyclostephanos tholiformis TaxID=382380 RepID=A0ABD3RCN2_9STRA